jgi:hypothetical protein
MGPIDKRLRWLEDSFELQVPDDDEPARQLFREALKRLGDVEMAVFGELLELYYSSPETSTADVWRELSEPQRMMEAEWRKVVTTVAREEPKGLERDVILAVANAPFHPSLRTLVREIE